MKISLLIEREDFFSIFASTLSASLSQIYGEECEVVSYKRSLFDRMFNHKSDLWLCNPSLNSIYLQSANSEIFHILFDWYGKNHSPVMSLIQRFYIYLATSKYLRGFFSSYAISITPIINKPNMVLIIGGNSCIRIFDFSKNVVTTLLKDGFCKRYVQLDIENRNMHNWLPTAPLIDIFTNNYGYIEPIIKADFFLYYSDYELKHKYFQKAIEICEKLSKSTEERVDLSTYISSLFEEIESYIVTISSIDNKFSKKINKWAVIFKDTMMSCEEFDSTVQIGQSHGDLTPGNLLVKLNEIIIIDWERTRKRIIGFDQLTLILRSRQEKSNFLRQLVAYFDNQDSNLKPIFSNIDLSLVVKNFKTKPENIRSYISVYILEELVYYLEESSCGPMKVIPDGLRQYFFEIQTIEDVLY